MRIHDALRMIPAMVAGVTKELWSIRDLIEKANDLNVKWREDEYASEDF